ncbi:hypothetical protein O3P69_005441 [Scylla paramamosain]|uniref:Uncharacterized protein n=1 Tax=Scylla paramamosain TaxID=85552 RepID=A0AAW0U9J0_SCYPA
MRQGEYFPAGGGAAWVSPCCVFANGGNLRKFFYQHLGGEEYQHMQGERHMLISTPPPPPHIETRNKTSRSFLSIPAVPIDLKSATRDSCLTTLPPRLLPRPSCTFHPDLPMLRSMNITWPVCSYQAVAVAGCSAARGHTGPPLNSENPLYRTLSARSPFFAFRRV